MQQKNPGRTLVLWIIVAHLFMGMVAYEWLPVSFRGSWIFILILLISGAFLKVGASLIVGLIAFVGVAVYFLLDLGAQTHIERQLLLLFIIPLIPLFLSAVRHNIEINVQKYRDIQSYDRNYRRDIFPLSALKYFQRSFFKLLDHHHIQDYEVFEIRILNRSLIKEMLGDDVWKTTQNEMIKILSQHHPQEIVFQFADDDLETIYSIVIRKQKTDEDPDFIKKLKQIMTLRLEVEYKVIQIPPEEEIT